MNLQGLSYELSLRALGQQERGLEELRNRTGTLLAASSLVASFLGARAIDRVGVDGIALVPLLAFILSVLLSVYVLAPKANLEFALRGSEVWEYFVSEDDDLSEAPHACLLDRRCAREQPGFDRSAAHLFFYSLLCFGGRSRPLGARTRR